MIHHSAPPKTARSLTIPPLPTTVSPRGQSWYRWTIKSGDQIGAPRPATGNKRMCETTTAKTPKFATFLPRASAMLPRAMNLSRETIDITDMIPLELKRQIPLESDPPAQIEIATPDASLPVPIHQLGGRNLPQ